VKIGDGHPALSGMNQGVAMIQPNPARDRAQAIAGGRILRLRAGIPVEHGYRWVHFFNYSVNRPVMQPQDQPQVSESELLQVRRDKLDALKRRGVAAFGGKFEISHDPGALKADFSEGLEVRVAGRIFSRREMGKACFFDIGDISGRIQVYINKKEVGDEVWEMFIKEVDIGDFVGVTGKTFVTKTGESSIHTEQLTFLGKSLRPLPDKWHGVSDREIKYRQRYLDLLSNERSREVFVTRSKMVAEIRAYLSQRDFLEVETPMMQDVAGGAAATPFETYHNALGMPLYLRIAPELFLKRLLVGGFTRIFELNRNFRNEGLSRRHNPEFTMLEAYWAFADFEQMADLVEGLICHLAEKFCGGLKIEHKDEEGNVTKTIDLTRPWKRTSYRDLLKEVDAKWFDYTPEERLKRAEELGVEIGENFEDYEVTQHVFEKLVEAHQFNPLFVTHCPKELVPLAKQNPEDDSVVDVYELVINGQEISPGYSELNDPQVQRSRLLEQAGEEIQKIDEEFILALEHGMPPAGGIGIGIDRLIMMLTGAESIRDVVLFPQLKKRA
jgi:lysyl-tRNA synthetase class 2